MSFGWMHMHSKKLGQWCHKCSPWIANTLVHCCYRLEVVRGHYLQRSKDCCHIRCQTRHGGSYLYHIADTQFSSGHYHQRLDQCRCGEPRSRRSCCWTPDAPFKLQAARFLMVYQCIARFTVFSDMFESHLDSFADVASLESEANPS